jgi:hypothetical protein
MKTNHSLFRIALLLVVGCAFLLPSSVSAQSRTFPNLLGHYRGFSQSIGDPDARGPVELNINFQAPPDPDKSGSSFSGFLTMGSMLPFSFAGKVDANGIFKFQGRGAAGGVTGTGKWQDLTRGGALVLATYKFTPTTGAIDQGKVDALRGFVDPPEPETPPDIAGSWRGTFESDLSLMTGADEWVVQQDQTKSGTPSTGFMGQERMDMGAAGIIIYDFVGTIDGQGNFVRIGNSARGFMVNGGEAQPGLQDPPEPELQSHAVLNFVDGGVDVVSMNLTQPPP